MFAQVGIVPVWLAACGALVIQELKDADYIAILSYCVCRTSFKCEHYPASFGCIFMGPNARHAVEAGAAREATVEEAIAHVKKAAELGLVGAVDHIEGEQFIWGVQQHEMNEYRMICFCCDCCCLTMNILKKSQRDVSSYYSPVGWTAVVDHTKCVGCKKCAERCPTHCISFGEGGLRITDQDKCIGCGFCKLECKVGAIQIKQTMPMRASINEYHLNEARINDGKPHAAVEPSTFTSVLDPAEKHVPRRESSIPSVFDVDNIAGEFGGMFLGYRGGGVSRFR